MTLNNKIQLILRRPSWPSSFIWKTKLQNNTNQHSCCSQLVCLVVFLLNKYGKQIVLLHRCFLRNTILLALDCHNSLIIWCLCVCPGLVPESQSQMEATGENRCQHHEAPWLPHALLQPPAYAPLSGAHEQLTAPWPLADIPSIRCHYSTEHPRVHGSYTRIASGLSKSRFPQPTPNHGPKHAAHGTTSIPMPSSLHWQIPFGGHRSAQFKHRRSEDES